MSDRLRAALLTKVKVGPRRLNQLIQEREERYLIPRRLAMLVLARDLDVPIGRLASDEEKEALRAIEQQRARSTPAVQPVAAPASPTPSRRAARQPSDAPSPTTRRPRGSKTEVFVVHGRDEKIRKSMFAFLRTLGLKPMEWGQLMKMTEKATPSIPEVVEKALERASAVVVVMTPDDDVSLTPRLRGEDDDDEAKLLGQARPNVFYEAGMAVARHPLKTVFVSVGKVKKFSDISGFHVTKLNNTGPKRNELVVKLETAGAAVDRDGGDWLNAGDFEIEEN